MENNNYRVTDNNITIFDSYKVSKKKFKNILNGIKSKNPQNNVFKNRKISGMCLEWVIHNFCYLINFHRERTKDVDLNYPEKTFVKIGYCVIGSLVWLFIK